MGDDDDDDDSVCVSVCAISGSSTLWRGHFRASQEKKRRFWKQQRRWKEKRKRRRRRDVCSLVVVVLTRFRFFPSLHHLSLSRLLVSLFFSSFHPLPIFDKCSNRHPRPRPISRVGRCLVLCHWAVCRLFPLCLLPLLVLFAYYR